MVQARSGARFDVVAQTLARNRLGVPAVVFFVLAAAAPLTVVAGGATTGWAVTGVIGIPISYLAVGVVLAVFSVGYTAMSRKIVNAGAFYSYIAQGLGRVPGVGAAFLALYSYNLMQIGLYGGFGVVAAAQMLSWFGVGVRVRRARRHRGPRGVAGRHQRPGPGRAHRRRDRDGGLLRRG
jgi:amino acid transporter